MSPVRRGVIAASTSLRDEIDQEPRLLPTNVEAEQRLLGAIFCDNAAYGGSIDIVRPEHFAWEVHGRIFAAIGQLLADGTTANPVTLAHLFDADPALKENGGAKYLVRLARAAVTVSNAPDYACAIVDCALRRESIPSFESAVDDLYQPRPDRTTAQIFDEHRARLEAIATGATGKAWPEPARLLRTKEVPSFPLAFLPGALADFVRDQADIMQTPVDFIAIPLLIAAGAVIGKDFLMAPKALAPWTERPCLWGGCIAHVGSNKTAGFNAALDPVWRLQGEFREAHRHEMKDYQPKARLAKAMTKQWERASVAALGKGEEPPEAPPGIPAAPTVREIVANDTTQERLVEMMQHNPRGIMLYRDELSGWFHSFNQYRAGADEQFFLQCHAGGPWAHNRKAGDFFVPDLFLCIFGGFQPDIVSEVLTRRTGQHKAPDNGMAARFSLLVWPEPIKGFEYVDRRRDRDAGIKAEKLFRDLASLDPERFVGAKPKGARHHDPFRFTPEAQAVFREWYVDHHAALGAMEPGDPLKGHFHKYDGLFARLALVHHLVRYVLGERNELARVDHCTATAVRDFIDNYLRPHAEKIYRHLGRGTAYHGAQKIARWIASHPTLASFTTRDISRKEWSGLTEPDQIDAALKSLEDVAGWIRGEEIRAGPKGGRPTKTFLVNPKVRDVQRAATS